MAQRSERARATPISGGRLPPDPTTVWARDVVEGRVVAGDLLRRACRRHLDDLKHAGKRGLVWRPERAAHALGFFPAILSVTAGAMAGEPFNLPSYTTFVIGSLFGWHRTSGVRRFRVAWLELGKGQIKSPLLAACGLYLIGFCDIPRAEAYAIAKDRFQANVLFMDAVAMCRAPIPGEDETLEQRGERLGAGGVVIRGVGDNAWKIEHPDSGSKFQSLAGDEAVAGPRPVFVAADEIHEWRSDKPIQDWQAALAKMPGSPLMMLATNTPAADQLVGTDLSEHFQRILRGEIEEDASFALIARTDVDDDPMTDESCWPKALPCLGLTFPIENVRDEVVASRHRIAKALATKRLYFGIPVGTSEYWIDLDAWESVQGQVDPPAMIGRPCWLGMDLSLKNDLTALAICWRADDGKLHATVRYWKPRDGDGGLVEAARSDAVPYPEWAAAGHLIPVPGRSIEYEFVAAEVERWVAAHAVALMAFDPAHSGEFRKACDRIGFATWVYDAEKNLSGSGLKMMIHGQGKYGMNSRNILWMPRSLQQLEDLILTGGVVIDQSPVTKWCSGNAAVEPDAAGNRWFKKKRSRGRIDGLVALAMVIGAASATDAAPRYNISDFLKNAVVV